MGVCSSFSASLNSVCESVLCFCFVCMWMESEAAICFIQLLFVLFEHCQILPWLHIYVKFYRGCTFTWFTCYAFLVALDLITFWFHIHFTSVQTVYMFLSTTAGFVFFTDYTCLICAVKHAQDFRFCCCCITILLSISISCIHIGICLFEIITSICHTANWSCYKGLLFDLFPFLFGSLTCNNYEHFMLMNIS